MNSERDSHYDIPCSIHDLNSRMSVRVWHTLRGAGFPAFVSSLCHEWRRELVIPPDWDRQA